MNPPILTVLMLFGLTGPCFSQVSPGKDTVVSPIVATLVGPGRSDIRITNREGKRSLSNVNLAWEQQVSGRVVQKAILLLPPIAPAKSSVFHLPLKPAPDPRDEAFINIRYIQRKKDSLYPAGHILAVSQLLVKPATDMDINVRPNGPLTFTDENGAFVINSSNASIRFSKQTGYLQQYVVKGDTLLDETTRLQPALPVEPRLQLFSTSTSSELAIISADYSVAGDNHFLHLRYTINAGGEMQIAQSFGIDTAQSGGFIQVGAAPSDVSHAGDSLSGADSNHVSPTTPGVNTSSVIGKTSDSVSARKPSMSLSRFGMSWDMPLSFDSIAWYGGTSTATTGPATSNSPLITIARQLFSPGDYTRVRWLRLSRHNGRGIIIHSDSAWLDVHIAKSGSQTKLDLDTPRHNQQSGDYHYLYKVTPL